MANKIFLDEQGIALYDKLVKQYISAEDAAEASRAQAKEAELLAAINALAAGAVKDNTDAIAVLNGEGDGSVKKQVDDAVAAVVNGAPETLNTLKEIADWINEDPDRAALITTKISQNESDIKTLNNEIDSLKAYVDAQDESYYNKLIPIDEAMIKALFKVSKTVAEGQTVADAINALGENEKLVLEDDCAENLTIPANATIDANGHELSGALAVSKDAIIMNAVFTGKVTITE